VPITLHIPPRLQVVTEKQKYITIPSAETLQDALLQLVSQYPKIKNSLFITKGRLSPYLRLSINDEIISDLNAPLPSDCDVIIFAAIAGG
jgi:molybdopterin converting factor small subunit